ncbi:MAG TPA: hypothetical protein VKZ88_05610 [Fibrobacteria bacterium]|jgi:hypothetical protein|nr:hypothetical protein [Fibrobacteria bacterium]
MARPRKVIHDDRYDETALNHDLTPEEIRARTAALEASEAGVAADGYVIEEDSEQPLEIGARDDGSYFDVLRDDDSEDDY